MPAIPKKRKGAWSTEDTEEARAAIAKLHIWTENSVKQAVEAVAARSLLTSVSETHMSVGELVQQFRAARDKISDLESRLTALAKNVDAHDQLATAIEKAYADYTANRQAGGGS